MCLLPAMAGMFGNKAQGIATGAAVGGLPGALIGSQLAGKKKRKPDLTAAQSTPPIYGASPSFGG